MQIIDENYSDEDLSLTGVSNTLAVSPNYLSALIKKTQKKNFITLLTERRMKAAYDMLVCTGMKVLEVWPKSAGTAISIISVIALRSFTANLRIR